MSQYKTATICINGSRGQCPDHKRNIGTHALDRHLNFMKLISKECITSLHIKRVYTNTGISCPTCIHQILLCYSCIYICISLVFWWKHVGQVSSMRTPISLVYAYRSLDLYPYTRKQVKCINAWGGTIRSGVRMLDVYWCTPFWHVS